MQFLLRQVFFWPLQSWYHWRHPTEWSVYPGESLHLQERRRYGIYLLIAYITNQLNSMAYKSFRLFTLLFLLFTFFYSSGTGVVSLIPSTEALTYVNGNEVTGPKVLKTSSRIILGNNHVFRFTNPEEGL